MSSSVFNKQSASPASTRRTPTVTADVDPQRTAGRRSLSGKFRSLFRRNSQSPKRAASNVQDLPPPVVRSRSPSIPETETPQLRAPTVVWPFGKKAKGTASPPPPSTKSKVKISRKSKKKPAPVIVDEVRRATTEFTPQPVERTPSFPSYEATPTKGFRDYMIIGQVGDPWRPNCTANFEFLEQCERGECRPSTHAHLWSKSTLDTFTGEWHWLFRQSLCQFCPDDLPNQSDCQATGGSVVVDGRSASRGKSTATSTDDGSFSSSVEVCLNSDVERARTAFDYVVIDGVGQSEVASAENFLWYRSDERQTQTNSVSIANERHLHVYG